MNTLLLPSRTPAGALGVTRSPRSPPVIVASATWRAASTAVQSRLGRAGSSCEFRRSRASIAALCGGIPTARCRRSVAVTAGRSGGRRNRDDRGSRNRDDDFQYAMRVLQREWPRLALPVIGVAVAVSVVGPMLFGAAFLALAVAGVAATLTAPLVFVIGAGMLAGGAGVAAAVGLAGLYLLPSLLSLVAIAGGAVLGARLVGGYLAGGGSRSDDDYDDDFSSSRRRGEGVGGSTREYNAWTGGERQQQGSRGGKRGGEDSQLDKEAQRQLERDLERMRRDADNDLAAFDEAMRAKERLRRGSSDGGSASFDEAMRAKERLRRGGLD